MSDSTPITLAIKAAEDLADAIGRAPDAIPIISQHFQDRLRRYNIPLVLVRGTPLKESNDAKNKH